ncbi:MAG: nitrous oxide-stimulated promoter family protein [Desulfuromonas sp.]|nr:nitrous oxide-stimulated promoter family protein [Desulfuromonas sp.]
MFKKTLTTEQRLRKDAKVLRAFIAVYCRVHHLRHGAAVQCREQGRDYCAECHALLHYALQRNDRCPLEPKPACKDCDVRCYKPQMREKIREVMKFSGIYYVKRGRLDWLWHYFF